MKTQISRDSFELSKRYSSAFQQMGRMLTDDDWNVLGQIVKERLDEVLRDLIGSGTPDKRGIVRIQGGIAELRWGYVYVDGIVAQVRPDPAATLTDPNGLALEFDHQADFPEPPAITATDYRLYLDVWERTVISLEDESLRDAGLHGADTCTRNQTMAQGKWCPSTLDPEEPSQNPPKGDARLSVILRQGSSGADPCDPCADDLALQQRVGNYLFRAEVHQVDYDAAGQPERIVLKWSSENGAEQYIAGDEPLGFKAEDWVYELYSLAAEKHLGKHLNTDALWTPSRGELSTGYPATLPALLPWVRRWDGFCELILGAGVWTLVAGSDRGQPLSTTNGADDPGHVGEGTVVTLNLDAINLSIDLDNRQLLAGDFWLAPVREAVHKSGDILLDDALPRGILHHYMTLATVSGTTVTPYSGAECKRLEFPPLTDLHADDICFDNTQCDLPAVKTVQGALDEICHARDLRFHNKHLHGWGIVCGLVAECGPLTIPDEESPPVRHQVVVQHGYAIDCEGNDIILPETQEPKTVDILAAIPALDAADPDHPVLNAQGDGSVCLTLALDVEAQPQCIVERSPAPEDFLNRWLEGTLWMDMFQDCILDVVMAIQEELDTDGDAGGTDGDLVSPAQKRLTTLQNLLVQQVNPTNGAYVFLSPKEHAILAAFYERLRELLQSKTFCAQFQGQAFPPYPFPNTGLTTAFGKGYQQRILLHPAGNRLYAFAGTDNKINIYDLDKEILIQVAEMPAGDGAEILDLAFSPDDERLYAVAVLRGVDTVFNIADIQGDKLNWRNNPPILCDIVVSRLIASQKDPKLIYAIGKGKGLFLLRPDQILDETKPRPAPKYAFNAVGHLVVDEAAGFAYATANSGEVPSVIYDRIVRLGIAQPPVQDNNPPTGTLPLTGANGLALQGQDDIALGALEREGIFDRLYVVVNPIQGSNQKSLLTYTVDADPASQPKLEATLGIENTSVHLAFHRDSQQLLMAMEDGYRLQLVDVSGQKTTVFRHPVQISPIASAVAKDRSYVLNYASNTLSVIPDAELNAPNEAFLKALAEYRSQVLSAFYGLAGGLLQYLKDCFCHHLLVDCPTCDEDDKLYLAQVEIRGNQVLKVCNFSKRRYVKTFPTVEYWLSAIPIIPLIKLAVESLCCAVLPDLFTRYTPRPPAASNLAASNTLSSNTMQRGVQSYKRFDLQREGIDFGKMLSTNRMFLGDELAERIGASSPQTPGVKKSAFVDLPVEEAQHGLQAKGVIVDAVEVYEPGKGGSYRSAYNRTPARLNPGDRVTLYQKDGKAVFYAIAEPKAIGGPVTPEVKAEIDDLERRKTLLRDFSVIRDDMKATAATREALQSEVAALQAEVARLSAARDAEAERLKELETQRLAVGDNVEKLKGSLDELAARQKELSRLVNRGRALGDVPGVTPEIETELKQAGIRTAGDLADADVGRVARPEGRITKALAKTLINNAKARIEGG